MRLLGSFAQETSIKILEYKFISKGIADRKVYYFDNYFGYFHTVSDIFDKYIYMLFLYDTFLCVIFPYTFYNTCMLKIYLVNMAIHSEIHVSICNVFDMYLK